MVELLDITTMPKGSIVAAINNGPVVRCPRCGLGAVLEAIEYIPTGVRMAAYFHNATIEDTDKGRIVRLGDYCPYL